jgi:hypothetical protein
MTNRQKRPMGPALQSAIIRGLVRRITDLRASMALDVTELRRAEEDLARARRGEF